MERLSEQLLTEKAWYSPSASSQTEVPLTDCCQLLHSKRKQHQQQEIKPDIEVSLDTSLLNKNKDEITHDEDNQLQEALKAVEKEK